MIKTIDQWFSTGVPRNPWVPQKALRVPPISELDWYLLVNCSKGCRQIVKKLMKGAANQKRLRNTAIDTSRYWRFYNLVHSFLIRGPRIRYRGPAGSVVFIKVFLRSIWMITVSGP